MNRIKSIEINSKNPKLFFKQYLQLINPLFNLSEREMSIVALIMYYSHVYRKIEDLDNRMTVVFSTSCRADIREELDLSKMYFNNLIFRLRRKGVLEGNLVNRNLYIEIGDNNNYNLNFNFTINTEGK